jgi:hypothetical protein
MTLLATATLFADAFTKDTRNDGAEFYRLTDLSPKWMGELVQTAHADMFPDDHRYAMIRSVAIEMVEVLTYADSPDFETLQEAGLEKCDSLVTVYTMQRLKWLASDLSRITYCDDAAEENGTMPEQSMFERIGLGMLREYEEIWQLVAEGLSEQVDESEEESAS